MRVSNEAFRGKYQDLEVSEDLSLAELAVRLGWLTTDRKTKAKKPDSSRVGRTLGLVAENGKFRDNVNNDNAILLCRALHIDPIDVGL